MNRFIRLAGLGVLMGLGGCASQYGSEQALQQASADFQKVKEDTDVLRSAPKDVIRAGESLARAERLSSYAGSGADVRHYAYLSSRYSEIAREHSNLVLSRERLARLELERQRLQLALRETRLAAAQRQGEQMLSLATEQSERGLVMTLGDRLFDDGDAQLNAAANRTVLKIVQFLQLNPRRIARIEGYTDNAGEQQAGLKRSRERAQAVADVLIDLGVDEKRLQVEGYGEQFAVDSNASERGRAQNRRVEIVFSDEKGRLSEPR